MKKKKKVRFSPGKTLGLSMVGILLGGLLGIGSSVTYALIDVKTDEKKTQSVSGIVYDDFQIHFMELGNIYAGDSIFIKAGENDILIDAGSRASSGTTIRNYIDRYCEDGKLEYVIATHAHQDHIAAFGCTDGIFYSYSIGTIIDFPLTNSQTGTYRSYLSGRAYAIDRGAVHYSALDCWNENGDAKRTYALGENITMEILYNTYYETTTTNENDYSVCLLFTCGEQKFLLTGDLEEKGEKFLAENSRDAIQDCALFKAGHHGSYTASGEELLEIVRPAISVCTCVCGSTEYTKNNDNTFPSQAYIDRISAYTSQVYVTSLCNDYESGEYTSMNGDIIVSSDGTNVGVACSKDSTPLKDTAWFQENRTCPAAWLNG